MQTMQRGRNNANKSSADKAMLTKKFNQRNSNKERKEKMKENMLKILKTILLVTASVLLIYALKIWCRTAVSMRECLRFCLFL